MKKVTKVLYSGLITAALGAGVFAGNSLLVSHVFAADQDADKLVITQDSSAGAAADADQKLNTVLESVKQKNKDGATAVMRTKDGKIPTTPEGEIREGIWDEGVPGAQEITKEQALGTAKAEIIAKYALRPEILDRFTITTTYHEAGTYIAGIHGNNGALWMVELQPTDQGDYPEIGTYVAYLDSKTGKVIVIFSAADAVG